MKAENLSGTCGEICNDSTVDAGNVYQGPDLQCPLSKLAALHCAAAMKEVEW